MKQAKASCILLLLMLSLLAVAMAGGDDDAGTIRLPADGKAEAARKPRPWDCCDHETCNRKLPPDGQCSDKVKSCSRNCEDCEPVMGEGLFVCRDIYAYQLDEPFAPKCNPSASASAGN